MRVSSADRIATSPKKPASKAKNSRQTKRRKTTARRKGGIWRIFGKSVYWSFVVGIWGAIGVSCIVGFYAIQLPQSSNWSIPQRPPNARIVSLDGQLIANRGTTGGAAMPLDEMSPYIPMAVIAIEDRRFKWHFGFDPVGFTRAMVSNLVAGRLVQGGSTLTQQLAKNLFLKPERTVERKIQELILAVWLETKFSKDEILELYLNRVYFGSGAYGVDAASRRYFNKSARDVNLAEAAILAGVLKAPSRLSPARNPQLAEDRAQVVLGAMRRADFVTDRETTKALSMQAKKAKRYWSGSEHYVADMVMKELPALIGEMRVDVVVDTTFDLSLQNLAGQIIAETLDEYGEKLTVSQGALVAMSPNGAIRALVGGREYADSQFNRATEAKRQPGSAFKPFVYLAALEAGRTPSSVRQDAPVKIGNWTPENYDRKYRGPVTLDTALAKSLNTVAAQLVMEVGPQTVVETAQRLGIRSKLQRNASIALGTSEVTLLELVTAFAPFSNGGEAASPFVIKRVKDLDGNILYEREATSSVKVVRSRELGMMNAMLSNVISSGTGKAASLNGRPAAGKTGTSQNSRDGLFIGYTADMIAGVWYGNDDGSPTQKVTGGSLPAKSWQRLMSKAHEGLPLSVLPGNYAPEVAAVPTVRPKIGISGGGGELDGMQSTGQSGNKRRTLSDIENPTPSVEVGQTSMRKRKTLLDLIFGG